MAAGDTSATRWAVLIGVNSYGGAEDLKGCVRDVSAIRDFLERGEHPVDVAILTATVPSSADATSRRVKEDPENWPTWANVIKSLKRVLDHARPGDLFYLHFSGHGTRLRESAKSAHAAGNLALVLFDEAAPGTRYFPGQILASCLRRIVDRGIIVTAVLDCCFSGSVLRDGDIRGTDVRAIQYNPDVGMIDPDTNLFGSVEDSFRDALLPLDQWLINPEGYAVLAACGPHEVARELELRGGQRRGALSYFLMEALWDLRKRGVYATHESLYEHLRVRFRAAWPQQRPMRYGNRNLSFFGRVGPKPGAGYVQIYKMGNEGLCLDEGEAHGVRLGDEYTVAPFQSQRVDNQPHELVMVRVNKVGPLTSDVVPVRVQDAAQVETGWTAKRATSIRRGTIPVRLAANVHRHMRQNMGTAQQSWLHLCSGDETEACLFNLTVNDRREYEVLDGALEKVRNLPTLPVDTPEADRHVGDILHHLARFKYAEGIENQLPSPSFEASFLILSSAAGTAPGNSTAHEVKHGEIWRFSIENHSKVPLYLAVFDFSPSWGISNVLSSSGGSSFWVIQPKGREELELKMEVPDWLRRRGERQCEDIIKIFITSQPTSFPSLVLPGISLGGSDDRGRPGRHDGLSELLASLRSGFRGQDEQGQDAWSTRNYIIRTTVDENHCTSSV